MVKLRNPFTHPVNEAALQYRRDLTTAETVNDKTTPESDYVNTIGKLGYLLTDEHLEEFLLTNPILQPLIPLLSPVNSTTKLSKHEAELKRIRIDNFFTMLKLTMPPEIYEANGMETLDSLRLYALDRVSDAEEGWKGHIATEQTKTIRSEEVRRK